MDISVIVAAYGYGRYIGACLDSALAQTDAGRFEVIVVHRDAGDETAEVLAGYASDSRVRVVEQAGAGLAQGANIGIGASEATYVVRLDADDLFLPGCLAAERSALDANPDVDFAYADYVYLFEESGKRARKHLPDFDPAELQARGDFLSGGTMYRRELFERAGLFDESLSTLESYEFILRLMDFGVRGIHVPEPLWEYRIHGSSMSDDQEATRAAGAEIAARYGRTYEMGEHHPRRWPSHV